MHIKLKLKYEEEESKKQFYKKENITWFLELQII